MQPDKAHTVRELATKIPLNDFGLPMGYYRADLLPWHAWEPPTSVFDVPTIDAPTIEADTDHFDPLGVGLDIADVVSGTTSLVVLDEEEPDVPTKERRTVGFPTHELDAAFEFLNYTEGFPALNNGLPFWGQLEYEPVEAHAIFQYYLQMQFGTEGDHTEEPNDDGVYNSGRAATGVRSLSQLAANLTTSNENLLSNIQKYETYSAMYYWPQRAKSYDLYKVAAFRRQQEIRAIETQDSHYVHSRRLMTRLLNYMDEDEDFWDMMTPKVGLDMFKQLTQLQRVSAGLPAAGPLQDKDGGVKGGASLEVLFKQFAQVNNQEGALIDEEGHELVEKVLEMPEAIEQMQALIIKINGG